MKVTFVVPRYGPTHHRRGGDGSPGAGRAPGRVRGVGRSRCSPAAPTTSSPGTTCSRRGSEEINGVQVMRFASDAGRDPSFHPFSASLLCGSGSGLPGGRRAVDRSPGTGGPRPGRGGRAESDADALIFYPYLYYPTVRLIDRVRTPTILHPAAHDEPALRLPVFPGCSTPPTGWCSRPRPNGSSYSGGSRWPPIANSCSGWAWMIPARPGSQPWTADPIPVGGHVG